MKTKLVDFTYNGKITIQLIIPEPENIRIPHSEILDYETFCGPGSKWGDRAVPDTMYFLKVSPACFIHDLSWAVCEPTWSAFHNSNAIFRKNLKAIVRGATKNRILKWLRLKRCEIYFWAVDKSIGSKVFWEDKRKPVSNHIRSYIDDNLLKTIDARNEAAWEMGE